MRSVYDFAQFHHVVDVGGGDGALLACLLAGCPQLRGTLFDLPHVVAKAGEVIGQAGVAGRCDVVPGSFFDGVPTGGDAYLLKNILHDWDDEHALNILRKCRAALRSDTKLLVIERILAPPNEGAEGKLSDLNMLVNAGGRERTRKDFATLFASAGFTLSSATPLPMSRFVMAVTGS